MSHANFRSDVLRLAVVLVSVALAACEHEPVLTLVDEPAPGADVGILLSEATAAVDAQITLAIEAALDAASQGPLGAAQGALTWDPTALRYLGVIVAAGSQVAVNASAASLGSLRIAAVAPDGLGARVAAFGFEVLRQDYAHSLRFETDVLADLDFALVEARDVPGARRVEDLPSPTLATSASLAERLTGLEPDDTPSVDQPDRVPGAADLYGDGNDDGQINVLDALYAANVAVGNTVLGSCVVGTADPSRDCLAVNVEPSNLPGLGEGGDVCPPGVENACAAPATRIVNALDWLAITQEVTGDGHAIVGEPIPNARGGADRTSPADTVLLNDPPVVTGTLTFSADTLYVLESGELVVGDEGGAAGTVVFEPGVVFEGTDSTTGIRVTRNGRIIADGTSTEPITFSCRGPDPAPGCWQGLTVLGNAVVNSDLTGQPAPAIPTRNPGGGGNEVALDDDIVFGGSNDADDSGILRHVRILYAGTERGPGDTMLYSGLRVGACGSGTVIEYVQSHASRHDGVQLLGGRCDVRYMISSEAGDDLFDISWGYDGAMQHVIGVHAGGGDRAFEVANSNDVATYDALPRTAPSIWNLTVIGGSEANPLASGLLWHRGAQGEVRNALLVETQIPFEVTDGSCSRLPGGEDLLAFEEIIVLGRGAALTVSADCPDQLGSYVAEAPIDDRPYADELIDPFTGWLPDLRPADDGVGSETGSPATPPGGLDDAPYFGAVMPEGAGGALPWYAGWFHPWEPLPPSLAGGGDYRVAASCRDRLGSPVACTLQISSADPPVLDTVEVVTAGDTIVMPENRNVFVTAWDDTGFWRSWQQILSGRAGDVETVVFDLHKGGEFCGGAAESLDLVTVRPNSGCPGGGVVSTTEEAVFLVRDGGIIEFGRGEHRVVDQDVPRDGLTLRPVTGEAAVLAVGTPPEQSYDGPGFKLLGVGDYVIQDLVFRRRPGPSGGLGIITGPNNIRGVGAYASVTVQRTRFEGLRLAVITVPSTAADPRIDIIDSEFTTDTPGEFVGARGIFMLDNADLVEQRSPQVTIQNNRFEGTAESPMQGVFVFNGGFAETGPATAFALLLEGNEFSSCSTCVELLAATDATVLRDNTFLALDPASIAAAAVRVTAPIGEPRIEGNIIQGLSFGNGFTFAAGVTINLSDPASTGGPVLIGNTIQGATLGVSIDASFVDTASGTDNTFTDVTTVIQKLGTSTLLFTGNDFTDYVTAWSGDLGPGSLVCNWWGSAAGPGPSVNDAETVASPWADGPIANDGVGSCD